MQEAVGREKIRRKTGQELSAIKQKYAECCQLL